MAWEAVVLGIAAVGVVTPMAIWSLECLLALLPAPESGLPSVASRPRSVVLVPAHNEAAIIEATLVSLKTGLSPEEQLVVIADGCTDATADIARRCGALVLERHNPKQRGKSYALSYAVAALARDTDVFVVIDADCFAGPGAVDRIARLAYATGRPVQAAYLMEVSSAAKPLQPLAALAFRIRNVVRCAGLARLGLPCLLNGTGMALPASAIADVNLANGRIAEDKWLAADLSVARHPVLFCPEAVVTSRFPSEKSAEISQNTRWLHGHFECMAVQGTRLLWGALRQRRIDLFALFCEVIVPPLSLLVLLWAIVLMLTLLAGWAGWGWFSAIVAASGGLLMALGLAAVVFQSGDRSLWRRLLLVPFYVLARIPVFAAFLVRREKSWVRTARPGEPPRSGAY